MTTSTVSVCARLVHKINVTSFVKHALPEYIWSQNFVEAMTSEARTPSSQFIEVPISIKVHTVVEFLNKKNILLKDLRLLTTIIFNKAISHSVLFGIVSNHLET